VIVVGCEYKACQYGSSIKSVDRFFPSSKICNVCGYVNNDLKLQHRFWTCPECSAEHDRDINAAINIRNFNTVGATELQACGEDVRPADKEAVLCEAGSSHFKFADYKTSPT